jgi:anti-sigma factor RsiW
MNSGHAPDGSRCRELALQLSGYLDGELSIERAEALERHLAGCECCADFTEDLRRTIALCRRAGSAALPRAVQALARRRVKDLLNTRRPA